MSEFESSLPPRSERHSSKRRFGKRKKDKKTSFGRELLSTLMYIAVISTIFFFVERYFYAPVMVDGDSMETTLSDGDYLLLNKYSDIERYDVVVFPPPDEDDDTLYIKRVIGLPGDRIEFNGDTLILNGQEIDETYLDHSESEGILYTSGSYSLLTLLGEETVPEGHFFVLGDNRLNSRDSRSFGFIEKDVILGKVSLRYWPFEDFGMVE